MANRTVDILIAIASQLDGAKDSVAALQQVKAQADQVDAALTSAAKSAEAAGQAMGAIPPPLPAAKGAKELAAAVDEALEKVEALKHDALVDDLVEKFTGAKQEASGLADSLRDAFSIDWARRLTDMLAETGRAIAENVEEGIRYNAELQAMQVSLAGVFTAPAKGTKTFSELRNEAGLAIESIRQKANTLGLDFMGLLETYKTSAGMMFHVGVTDLQQQIDLVVTLQQALSAMGATGFMATRDAQDILSGRAQMTKAGRELGISDDDIRQASEQGQLYQFLTDKLKGYADAAQQGQHGFNAELARTSNELQELRGILTENLFEQATSGLQQFNKQLSQSHLGETAAGIGAGLGVLVDTVATDVRALAGATSALLQTLPGMQLLMAGAKTAVQTPIDAGANAYRVDQGLKQAQLLEQQARSAQSQSEEAKAYKDVQAAILAQAIRLNQEGDNATVNDRVQLTILTSLQQRLPLILGQKQREQLTDAEILSQRQKMEKLMADNVTAIKGEAQGNEQLLAQEEALAKATELRNQLIKEGVTDLNLQNEATGRLISAMVGVANHRLAGQTKSNLDTVRRANAQGPEVLGIYQEDLASARDEARAAGAAPGVAIDVPDNATSAQLAATVEARVQQEMDQSARAAKEGFGSPVSGDDITAKYKAITDALVRMQDAEAGLAKTQQSTNDATDKYGTLLKEASRTDDEILSKTITQADRQKMINDRVKELEPLAKEAGVSREQMLQDAAKEVDAEIHKKQLLQDQTASRKDGVEALKEERQLLSDIDRQIAAVQRDPFLTQEQKNAQLGPLYQQQRGQLLGMQAQGRDVSGQLDQNAVNQERLQPFAPLREDFAKFQDQLGSGAQNLGKALTGTLGTAIGGVSQGITGLITGTETWQQASKQALSSIISQLVQLGVQTLVHAALQRTVSTAAQAQSAAAQTQVAAQGAVTGAGLAASYAPAAAAVNAATYGAGADAGLASTLLMIGIVVAAIAALAATSFAEGGITGAGGKYQPAGVVHKGEYVLTQQATSHYGVSMLNQMNRMRVPVRGYADGGPVGSYSPAGGEPGAAASTARPVHVHVHMDQASIRKAVLEHPDAEHRIIKVAQNRKGAMGIPT